MATDILALNRIIDSLLKTFLKSNLLNKNNLVYTLSSDSTTGDK